MTSLSCLARPALSLLLLGAGLLTGLPWSTSGPGRSSPAARVEEVERGPLGKGQIALTFDAGGETDGLTTLLDALREAGVRCTFFLTGQWVEKHPAEARQVVAAGHEIGNHTWSHQDLTRLEDQSVREEIARAHALLTAVSGQPVRPWWRAPYGARDARVLRLAGDMGYISIYWTLDSLDSVDPPKSAAFLHQRITGRSDEALDGAIILMHVGEPATAQAVPEILLNLRRRGFVFVPVSTLLSP